MTFTYLRYAIYTVVLCFLLVVYLIEPKASPLPFSGQQIWKHRTNSPQEAINASLEGFPGVEVDLTFLNNQLHVAHDASEYQDAMPLAKFLNEIHTSGAQPYFWFDIKNINFANEAAITRELLDFNIAARMIVETPRPFLMFRLCSSGLICSVWAQAIQHWHVRVWYRFWVNMLSRYGTIASISVDYRLAHLSKTIVPPDYPKLLYTLARMSDAKHYQDRKGVRIVLID